MLEKIKSGVLVLNIDKSMSWNDWLGTLLSHVISVVVVVVDTFCFVLVSVNVQDTKLLINTWLHLL